MRADLLLLGAIAVPAAARKNLLKNPGFESSANAAGWKLRHGDELGACAVGARTGARAVGFIPLDDATSLVQRLSGLQADTPYHIVAYVWLPQDSVCGTASDNVNCPFLSVMVDGEPAGGSGAMLSADAGAWNAVSGAFYLTKEQVGADVSFAVTHFKPGERVCVDDVGVFRSSIEDFRAYSDKLISANHKRDVVLRIGKGGKGSEPVRIVQTKRAFPIGTAVNAASLDGSPDGKKYKAFIKEHFNYCADEQQLLGAWGSKMWKTDVLDFCDSLGYKTRGHAVAGELSDWSNDRWLSQIPRDGSPGSTQAQFYGRIKLWMQHYRNRVVDIEAANEMLNSRFYEYVLPCGQDGPCMCDFPPACPANLFPDKKIPTRAWMQKYAKSLAPNDRIVINEYCVSSNNCVPEQSTPATFVKFVRDINSHADGAVKGVSDQAHYYRGGTVSGFDLLMKFDSVKAQLGKNFSFWISEFDIDDPFDDTRADGYEQAMRAFLASRALDGVIIWGFWKGEQWRKDAYLVDLDWTLTPAGQRLFGANGLLTKLWKTTVTTSVNTQSAPASVKFRGFHGKYRVYWGEGGRCSTTINVPVGASAVTIDAKGWKCDKGAPPHAP
eukprot:TRINITY_DN2292_c2_g1_i1.p1 TRINITY_DN2292_c2_g1~~TRINITY_DN2292_c2_g1_i1.p1  ORF type:complete len:609 (+),score=150.27 TRINITY_DN2292_c2_g1_i1:216-2042(+)